MERNYLALQGSYKTTELALFSDEQCLEVRTLESGSSSSQLAVHIDSILSKHNLLCSDLSFIALNHGPGSFTSLRVLCSTVNGIAFAANTPLLEVSGFEALAWAVYEEMVSDDNNHLAVIFNAFNEDVYFAIYTINASGITLTQPYSYENINLFLERISLLPNLCFVGNGAILHREKIKHSLESSRILSYEMATIEDLGKYALFKWKESNSFTNSISPLYLKVQQYQSKYSTSV